MTVQLNIKLQIVIFTVKFGLGKLPVDSFTKAWTRTSYLLQLQLHKCKGFGPGDDGLLANQWSPFQHY